MICILTELRDWKYLTIITVQLERPEIDYDIIIKHMSRKSVQRERSI